MTTSAQIRNQLIQALTLDLVGPTPAILAQLELDGCTEEATELRVEVLDRPPNRWYQSGFLIPSDTNLGDRADDAADDEFAGLDGQNLSPKRKSNASGDDTGASEAGPARRVFFPCSVGLSLLIPPATGLEVTVHWASYTPTAPPEDSKADEAWCREPHSEPISLPAEWLAPSGRSAQAKPVPGSDGLMLRWHLRPAPADQGYPSGAVAVSLFLTNERRLEGRGADDRDRASAYQVQLDVACGAGFLERRDPRAADRASNANDWDHRVNNLHYRADHEFAGGTTSPWPPSPWPPRSMPTAIATGSAPPGCLRPPWRRCCPGWGSWKPLASCCRCRSWIAWPAKGQTLCRRRCALS